MARSDDWLVRAVRMTQKLLEELPDDKKAEMEDHARFLRAAKEIR